MSTYGPVAVSAAGPLAVSAYGPIAMAGAGPMAMAVSGALSVARAMVVWWLGRWVRGVMLCRGHRPIIARTGEAHCSARLIRR